MWQQARRPEIMVYAALVILGINSFSGRPTRILTTLRLGTFNSYLHISTSRNTRSVGADPGRATSNWNASGARP